MTTFVLLRGNFVADGRQTANHFPTNCPHQHMRVGLSAFPFNPCSKNEQRRAGTALHGYRRASFRGDQPAMPGYDKLYTLLL